MRDSVYSVSMMATQPAKPLSSPLRADATLLVAGALLIGAIWLETGQRRAKPGASYALVVPVALAADHVADIPPDAPTLRAACFIAFAVALLAACVEHRRLHEVFQSRIGGLYGP